MSRSPNRRILRPSSLYVRKARLQRKDARKRALGRLILQRPLAVAQPRQHALLVQGVQFERDLAAVGAAERLHDLRKELGARGQRVPHAAELLLRVEARRTR